MTTAIVVLILAIVVIVALGVWYSSRKRRTEQVRQQFGPEFDRTVDETGGDEHKATDLLRERRDRVEQVEIHPLSADDRDSYAQRWHSVQEQFVDDPGGAVGQADQLIGEAMSKIGYPVDDFNQREEAISVKYPEVANDYRTAHAISLRNDNGDASTEDLRNAMVLYRGLFERLVGMPQTTSSDMRS